MLIKPNHIYQEDCIAFMQRMKDERVFADVIVTSPPYNIGKDYGIYKDNKKEGDYLKWLQEVAKASLSILKEDGSFFLNIGSCIGKPRDLTLPDKVAERFKAAGYKLQNKIIWLKSVSIDQKYIGKKNELRNNSNNGTISIGHFTPINSDRYLNNLYEYVFHFTKKEDVKLDKLAIGVTYQDKSNIGRYAEQDKRDRGDVWFIPYDTIQKGRDHPAPFPIEIPQWSIELHEIKPNMLVYDPFMGEGNTVKACVGLGVNYIGTEINPKYIKTANEETSRITPVLEEQPTMLTSTPTQSGTLLSYISAPIE